MKKHVLTMSALACLLVLGVACEEENANEELGEAEAVEAEEEILEESGEEEQGAAMADEDEEADEEEERTASVGEAAPNFELEDESGETHKLSDYEGQTVVLEWFNPNCPFVQRHHNEEESMQATYEDLTEEDDLVWLAVDSTDGVEPEDSAEIKEEWEIDYPILQDPSGEVGKLYEAKTTPHMYVIDEDGVLQYAGAIDDDEAGKNEVDERTNYVREAVTALQEGEELDNPETKPYGCSVKYGS